MTYMSPGQVNSGLGIIFIAQYLYNGTLTSE